VLLSGEGKNFCFGGDLKGMAASGSDVQAFLSELTTNLHAGIAHLARIAIPDEEIEHLGAELNAILAFVEQLSEVDVSQVEPMTLVIPMTMKRRADVVTDGGDPDAILKNAPVSEDHFFLVPKVVE